MTVILVLLVRLLQIALRETRSNINLTQIKWKNNHRIDQKYLAQRTDFKRKIQ